MTLDTTKALAALAALAERCASATAGEQAELLRQVATAMFGKVPDTMNRMLSAGAFESASLMLVPEGCCLYQAGNTPDNPPLSKWWCALWREGDEEDLGEVEASTFALAIASAALKARMGEIDAS